MLQSMSRIPCGLEVLVLWRYLQMRDFAGQNLGWDFRTLLTCSRGQCTVFRKRKSGCGKFLQLACHLVCCPEVRVLNHLIYIGQY